jgi:glycosyltransferase involved in cell wall biosynthesis
MRLPRVLVVARRFWPSVDDDSTALLHWCGTLARRGCRVSVVTPRWHSSWPATSDCREVRIDRILPAPTSNWYTSHYVRNMGKWIGQHRDNWDCIYVDEPQPELFQICNPRVIGDIPIVGRVGFKAQDETNDVSVAVDAARRLDAVVVPDVDTERRLIAAGVQRNRLIRIPDICYHPVRLLNDGKTRARSSLVNLSSDFFIPVGAKVVVCLGEISQAAGCHTLTKVAMRMLEEDANLKFWLCGIDRQARQIYTELRDHAWHREIVIFGAFDDVEELLTAADLVVVPNFHSRMRFLFPFIVASGAPWIGPKDATWGQRLGPDADSLMWSDETNGMSQKLKEWYLNPEPIAAAAAKVAQRFLRVEPPESAVDAWISLLSGNFPSGERRE